MTVINRDRYLSQLVSKIGDDRVKIVTGVRRCGKSYLLFKLFVDYLLENETDAAHIIQVQLDKKEFENLRNPNELYDYVCARITGPGRYFVLIDEIQLSYRVRRDVDETSIAPEDRDLLYTTFYDVLNDLRQRPNVDVYVTGSNSRLLSTDIATNFRDRGIQIPMAPLSFAEFHAFKGGEKADDWGDYLVYGGMPLAVLEPDDRSRERYLTDLFDTVYKADLLERYAIADDAALEAVVNALCSAVGSLTNPRRLSNTLTSVAHMKTSDKTVKKYLDALVDAFLFRKAARFDVKGGRYFDYPLKYYATDIGLRNARLGFRQVEETHIMENIIFNELVGRGYSVDVGAISFNDADDGKTGAAMHEIDFVVNRGSERIYIQSALSIADERKREQEVTPLLKSGDFFRKVVVTGGSRRSFQDERGITYVGVIPFLLDENVL